MLPGFRFLFAAITLSMSLLVFGVGAASLFRAAHEAFASNSPWHGAPEATFAQRGEASPPVLAALRVDPPMIDRTPNEAVAASAPVAAEPAPTAAEPAAMEIAATKPANALPAESARTDGVTAQMPAVESPPIDAAPQAAEAAANSDQTKIAAATTTDALPDRSAPAIIQGEPAAPQKPDLATGNPPTAPEANSLVTKIATLGGPPVEIVPDTPANDKEAKPDQAKDDQSAIRKREEARRATQRRQAARARLVAQQYLLQQQANPFPLFPPPAPAARQR